MGLTQGIVELQRPGCRCSRPLQRFLGRQTHPSPHVGIREPGIREGVIRIFLDGLFEILSPYPCSFLCPFLDEVSALQVCFVSLGVHGLGVSCLYRLVWRKLQSDFFANRVCDLTLDLKHTLDLTVVLSRPDMALVTYLYELRGNP